MSNSYKKVHFQNSNNPSSKFDLVSLNDLLNRNYSIEDHSPFLFHQLKFFAIIFIQKGHGKHTIDFVDYECKKGTLLVIRKDQIHKFSKSNLEGILLIFTFDFLGSFYTKTETQKSLLLFNDFLNSPIMELTDSQFDVISKLIERFQQEYILNYDKHSQSIIRSELQILISKLHRINTQKHDIKTNKKHISKFIQFHNCIEERFSESLKVKDYARWLGVSTKTLNTVTQHIVQKSAKKFIDEICLNHIKRQLINTENSIKEISFKSGFEEASNFYSYFKKRVGKTPEEYRRSKR